MVVLETSYSRLMHLVGTKLSQKELEELLFQIGFELEDLVDDQVSVDITPDRLDALSCEGLARIIKNYLGKESYELPKVHSSNYEVIVDSSAKKVRPYTVCAVVKNLKMTDELIKEIMWVQEKLHQTIGKNRSKVAIGVYPLDKISWPISFCARKPNDIRFTPLESSQEMDGMQVVLTHPKGKAFAHLLENCSVYPIFEDADKQILSLPPIINSHHVGKITVDTTDVFIECSGFDLQLQNDVLTLLACQFADMGGELFSVKVIYDSNYDEGNLVTPQLTYEKRTFATSYVKEILGEDISKKEIKHLLERMLYKATVTDEVVVSIPPFRLDIWHDIDIVDDIVRAYGVNNITFKMPLVATVANKLPINKLNDQITDFLVGFGLQEIKTLGVADRKTQFEYMNYTYDDALHLGSVAEKSINMVRRILLPQALTFLAHNQSAEYPQRIFELGDVITIDSKADVGAKNQLHASICLCQDGVTVTDVKQIVEMLGVVLGTPFTFKNAEHPSFIEGRCAKIFYGKKEIGVIGEVAPQVLTAFNTTMPVAACEFTVEELV